MANTMKTETDQCADCAARHDYRTSTVGGCMCNCHVRQPINTSNDESRVDLDALRFIIDHYVGTPHPLNRTSLREAFDELERLRRRQTAMVEVHTEQIRHLTDSRDWWRRRWESEADENARLKDLLKYMLRCSEERVWPTKRIDEVRAAVRDQSDAGSSQQEVRQAMGEAYAREDPRSPRQRPVHSQLINGA